MKHWVGFTMAVALAIGADGARAAISSTVAGGVLTVTSDAGDAITITCPSGNVLVNGANPDTGASGCAALAQLVVNGGPLANDIDISAVTAAAFPALASRNIVANAGDDVVTGSPSADVVNGGLGVDTFIGNDGDDTFTGGDGNDFALLGGNDDVFVWSPGDDNDIVEGQAGSDVLRFNASNAAEIVDVFANGGRVTLFRNIAAVTMDLDDVERIELQLLGGADVVNVADTAGTDLLLVRADLAAAGGGGDGAVDAVVVNGAPAGDAFTYGPVSGGVAVGNGARAVQVVNAEAANDTLRVNGLAGADGFTASITAAGLVATTFDGGAEIDNAVATGTAGDDTIQAANNTGVVSIATPLGAVFSPVAVESVQVQAAGGNDTITSNGFASVTPLTVDGGPGNDTYTASLGADVFVGGAGNDTFTGGDGNDTAFLGGDDDVFVWNPGDDNDVVEGQAGNDVLRFNASNAAEIVDVFANGGRVTLFRNVAAVTMDLDDVEQLDLALFGGVDAVNLGDLSGTDLVRARLDLRAGAGGGDAAVDAVTVAGSNLDDAIALADSGGDVSLTVASRTVTLIGAEPANDALRANAGAGNDALSLPIAAAALVRFTFDGGARTGTGDRATIVGDALAETWLIGPVGADVRVGRSIPSSIGVDLVGTERFALDTLGGADAVTTQLLPATAQALDGGAPATFPGDTLAVSGFAGDVTVSPIVQPGFAAIAHANFEFGAFDGFLTGPQVVPPNASPARGTARVTLTPAGDAINVVLAFQGLTGVNTLTHIHGPAPRGVNATGAPLFVLPTSGGAGGSITAGPLAITAAQKAQLEAGQLYIDVHSAAFPNGEIRGQLDGIQFLDGFESP
ncbi:MAG TPA: CHRD domain-containing protein [Xanthomonadales bacterium]|nr:CHRD domain-containing protein [Xanthomonadales bacterium]